ncbi:DUF3888 domain-containing protein [Cohnella sp. 56]|uniref:DUF3888 domain-containing protein n=1 Tax=Cohnella sp. 56 TaxID=3113722 RepID=UPI0030EB112E
MNIAILLLTASLLTGQADGSNSGKPPIREDSLELQLQDMLTLLLLPRMTEKLAEAYADLLYEPPQLYPYFVNVNRIDRVYGFRSYAFVLKLDAYPAIGPHIGVGEDSFTFRLSSMMQPELVRFEHKRGPDKKQVPPNYRYLIK